MERLATSCALFALLLAAACVDPLTTHPVATPLWELNNIAGYGQTVAGSPPDVALGWDLRVEGGVARWRECTALDACGDTRRERPSGELLAFERVGRTADADGREMDILKLSLAPKPAYVVPLRKLPR